MLQFSRASALTVKLPSLTRYFRRAVAPQVRDDDLESKRLDFRTTCVYVSTWNKFSLAKYTHLRFGFPLCVCFFFCFLRRERCRGRFRFWGKWFRYDQYVSLSDLFFPARFFVESTLGAPLKSRSVVESLSYFPLLPPESFPTRASWRLWFGLFFLCLRPETGLLIPQNSWKLLDYARDRDFTYPDRFEHEYYANIRRVMKSWLPRLRALRKRWSHVTRLFY